MGNLCDRCQQEVRVEELKIICSNCDFTITGDDALFDALGTQPGYRHWMDTELLHFCSDQCISDYFNPDKINPDRGNSKPFDVKIGG